MYWLSITIAAICLIALILIIFQIKRKYPNRPYWILVIFIAIVAAIIGALPYLYLVNQMCNSPFAVTC